MTRILLRSSLPRAVGYCERLARLEVELHNRAMYRYECVPAQTYQDLLQAESKGGYFNRNIRNQFPCAKIHSAEWVPTRDDSSAFPPGK